MKLFRRTFLLLSLTATMFFVQCNCEDEGDPKNDDPATIIEQMTKTWGINAYYVDGTEDTSTDVSGFSMTLNSSDPNTATSYSITAGGAPNPAPSTSGNWSVNAAGTSLTFDGSTSVQILSVSENVLNIQWTVDSSVDKNTPTYRFDLVPR